MWRRIRLRHSKVYNCVSVVGSAKVRRKRWQTIAIFIGVCNMLLTCEFLFTSKISFAAFSFPSLTFLKALVIYSSTCFSLNPQISILQTAISCNFSQASGREVYTNVHIGSFSTILSNTGCFRKWVGSSSYPSNIKQIFSPSEAVISSYKSSQ